MVELTQPYIFDDFSSGMIDRTSVSESLLPRNAVRKAVNCIFDNPRGSVSGRLGSTLLGDSVDSQIRGLYNFRDAGGGTDSRLITTDSTGITYYLSGSSFIATLSGDTAGLKTQYVTFLDRVARLNGTDGVKSWDGAAASSWETTGGPLDVGDWPSGTKFAAVFNSRVYTAGSTSAPDTLYFSSIPSGGAIAWDSTNDNLQINPNDGDNGITGLGTNGTVLLVFKRNSLYRWDGTSTFANRVISVGTPSNESIAAHDSGWVYFFGTGKFGAGVYRTSGGYPQKISLNISQWIDAISVSSYENIAGFVDDDHYYLSVGSVTIDGKTYSNTWLVYTISLQAWHVEDRAHSFKVFSPYIDASNNIVIVGGDSTGNVHQINSGYKDGDSSPINAECEFAPIVFTTRSRTKNIPRVSTYATYYQGLQFLTKTDSNDFKLIGGIKQTEQNFTTFSDGKLLRGKRFYPKITVVNSTEPWQFDGFEFSEVKDEGNYQ